MLDAVKGMLKSKKFHAMILGVIALAATAGSGAIDWSEALDKGWILVMAYIGAQGIADIGKGKAEIQVAESVAIAEATNSAPAEVPAEG